MTGLRAALLARLAADMRAAVSWQGAGYYPPCCYVTYYPHPDYAFTRPHCLCSEDCAHPHHQLHAGVWLA